MRPVFASVILLTSCAFGQTAPKSPVFEAADVHLTRPRPYTNFRSDSYIQTAFAGGIYELHIASMADLIRTAYGIDTDLFQQSSSQRLFGGPTWLDTDRFEVIAKAPPNSTPADLRLMLQALLADRFKLVVHNADEPIDVFALTQGKKPLLKESQHSEDAGCDSPRREGPFRYVELNCHNIPIDDLVKQLRQWGWSEIKRPIANLTGLKGSYDFSLKWTPSGMMPPGEEDAVPYISFLDAVDKQLGLKLEAAKHPMPVLVIDSVNRTPTANAPGVAKLLPVTDEFEVATVKPSRPDDRMRRIQPQPGGRFEVENIPLRTLISLAWNMEDEESMIVDFPKWTESVNLDIVAKAAGPQSARPLPKADWQVMLQKLLKERFKVTAHTEDRLIPVWSLVVGKRGLKLQPGDPEGRSGCLWQGAEQRVGSRAIPAANLECRNVSMAQLADTLHAASHAYVDRPAVDNTGLKGVYTFTLTYSPINVVEALRNRKLNQAAEGQNDNASPPLEALSMFDALEKLGLHLESGQKHLEPILVIDHMEPLVLDN